jgi:hypothetical protein
MEEELRKLKNKRTRLNEEIKSVELLVTERRAEVYSIRRCGCVIWLKKKLGTNFMSSVSYDYGVSTWSIRIVDNLYSACIELGADGDLLFSTGRGHYVARIEYPSDGTITRLRIESTYANGREVPILATQLRLASIFAQDPTLRTTIHTAFIRYFESEFAETKLSLLFILHARVKEQTCCFAKIPKDLMLFIAKTALNSFV